jgi:hypothetical protein
MSQPRDSRLSFAKYCAHPTFTSVHPSAVAKIPVKQLRALVWYHATTAGKAKKAAPRVVDPRQWTRAQLLEHASTVLNGLIRKVGSPDLEVIMTQYHRESADDALVDALLASVSPPSTEAAGGRRGPSRRQERGAPNAHDERAEGEEEGADAEQSHSEEDREDEGGDGGEPQEEEGDEKAEEDPNASEDWSEVVDDIAGDAAPHHPPPRTPSRRPTGLPQLVTNAPKAGVKKAVSTSTTSKPASTRTAKSSPTNARHFAHCIACTTLNDITDRTPSFCSECGNRWGVPVAGDLSSKASTTEGSSTATATTPTTWSGAATFRAKPVSALVTAPHTRAPGLAPLDEKNHQTRPRR